MKKIRVIFEGVKIRIKEAVVKVREFIKKNPLRAFWLGVGVFLVVGSLCVLCSCHSLVDVRENTGTRIDGINASVDVF